MCSGKCPCLSFRVNGRKSQHSRFHPSVCVISSPISVSDDQREEFLGPMVCWTRRDATDLTTISGSSGFTSNQRGRLATPDPRDGNADHPTPPHPRTNDWQTDYLFMPSSEPHAASDGEADVRDLWGWGGGGCDCSSS